MCNLRVIKQFRVFSNDSGKVRIGQNSEATFFLIFIWFRLLLS